MFGAGGGRDGLTGPGGGGSAGVGEQGPTGGGSCQSRVTSKSPSLKAANVSALTAGDWSLPIVEKGGLIGGTVGARGGIFGFFASSRITSK